MDGKIKPLDPEETARVLQEVAERSARIFADFAEKNSAVGVPGGASDELGIAKAYMDLYAKMLSNPAALVATSANLMIDYMQLWQSSWMKMMGAEASPVAAPAKGDGRFKDEDWSRQLPVRLHQAVLSHRRAPHPAGGGAGRGPARGIARRRSRSSRGSTSTRSRRPISRSPIRRCCARRSPAAARTC